MEKRKLKMKVAGIYHLGDLGLELSRDEQKNFDALVADGMDKKMAREFVMKLRKDPGNLSLPTGEIVSVIGRASWPEGQEDPNPILFVQSKTGVVAAVRQSNTDKAE